MREKATATKTNDEDDSADEQVPIEEMEDALDDKTAVRQPTQMQGSKKGKQIISSMTLILVPPTSDNKDLSLSTTKGTALNQAESTLNFDIFPPFDPPNTHIESRRGTLSN